MLPKVVSACGGGLLLALTSGAVAGGTWVEVDDAPERPAAVVAPTNVLFDPNGTASFDTRLWLLNLDGTPVLGNDDAPGATFNVPGPGVGTLVVVGVVGLVGRTRRRRFHA